MQRQKYVRAIIFIPLFLISKNRSPLGLRIRNKGNICLQELKVN